MKGITHAYTKSWSN